MYCGVMVCVLWGVNGWKWLINEGGGLCGVKVWRYRGVEVCCGWEWLWDVGGRRGRGPLLWE